MEEEIQCCARVYMEEETLEKEIKQKLILYY